MPTEYPTAPGVRFQTIEGDPDYCVGDDGGVWSHKSGEWKRLRPTPQYRGHMAVWLGRGRQRHVHRLVLEAFVGPCPAGMMCRHLDGNPMNNQLSNLAWGTAEENQADSVRHGTAFCSRPEGVEHARHLWDHVQHKSGEKHHRAKLSDAQVEHVRLVVDPSKRDGTATRLAKEWHVSPALIRMIARGLRRGTG